MLRRQLLDVETLYYWANGRCLFDVLDRSSLTLILRLLACMAEVSVQHMHCSDLTRLLNAGVNGVYPLLPTLIFNSVGARLLVSK